MLMDVGPTKDGRLIPIFEERLWQLGSWLSVNGEAIYRSIPWSHQNNTLTNTIWYVSSISWRTYLEDNYIIFENITHPFELWWSQIEFTGDVLNRQLLPWSFQIQFSYFHSNVFMCIGVHCHIIDKMTYAAFGNNSINI
jgi:hypothetical protein